LTDGQIKIVKDQFKVWNSCGLITTDLNARFAYCKAEFDFQDDYELFLHR